MQQHFRNSMERKKDFKTQDFDSTLLLYTGLLLVVGLLFFVSSAFSVLGQKAGMFSKMMMSQFGLGALGGSAIAYVIAKKFSIKNLFSYSLPLLILGALSVLSLYIPGVGVSINGARRWIHVGFLSFQPAELLKITAVIASAWWYTKYKPETLLQHGMALFVCAVLPAGILLAQPDTDGAMVLIASVMVIAFVSNFPLKALSGIGFSLLLGVGILIMTRPYIRDRFETYLHPEKDPQGTSFQIIQSFIAVGSGKVTGRGFGQSVQKFTFLPEPLNDSLFAVIAEEIGFVGSVSILALYLLFYHRICILAKRVSDEYSSFLLLGLGSLITFQAIINIMSNLGLFPLSGLPLPFMSQGGTALALMLICVGLMLCASKEINNNQLPKEKESKKKTDLVLSEKIIKKTKVTIAKI
jgi:cell division protein FtsW